MKSACIVDLLLHVHCMHDLEQRGLVSCVYGARDSSHCKSMLSGACPFACWLSGVLKHAKHRITWAALWRCCKCTLLAGLYQLPHVSRRLVLFFSSVALASGFGCAQNAKQASL
jgi:hypothetical protein